MRLPAEAGVHLGSVVWKCLRLVTREWASDGMQADQTLVAVDLTHKNHSTDYVIQLIDMIIAVVRYCI